MKRPGLLLYRCRRCQQIDASLHTPCIETSLICLTLGVPDPAASGITAHMVSTHQCNDGCIGVTDIVGGMPDPGAKI